MRKILQTPHFYTAFFLTALICLLPIISILSFDYKRIAEIILIMLMLTSLVISQSSQQSLVDTFSQFKSGSRIAVILLVGLGMLSSYMAREPEQAFIEIITLFSLLLIAQQGSQIWQCYPRSIDYLLLALVFSILLIEIKFIAYYVAFLSLKNVVSSTDFFFTFDYVRFFNQYQTWLLPIPTLVLLVEHPWTKSPLLKKTLWFIALIWWIMFFASCGRGVIVALVGGFIITLLLFGRHSYGFLKWTALTAAIGFLFYLLLFLNFPDESMVKGLKTLRPGSSFRLDYLWPKAISYIAENPFLGIGPMHYAWFPSYAGAHPHNSLLQWGAEWGLPALCLILFLIFRALKGWVLRFNKTTLKADENNFNLAVISLSFSIFSAILYSLVDGVIVMPLSHLTGTLIISLMFAVYLPYQRFHLEKTKSNYKLSIPFAFIVISYFYLVIPEVLPRLLDPSFAPENRMDVIGPRFWDFGDISK